MKIIGHRGAAGLALENTIESILAAKKAGVDAIEFDIRLTSDNVFVLMHDHSVDRVSEHNHVIQEILEHHIQDITLHNGEKLPTLSEALHAAGSTPVIIEAKGTAWAESLAHFLDSYNSPLDATVISYNHQDLGEFAKLCPAIPTYAIEHLRVFEAIQFAKQNGFTGVDMNFWILNPLTYFLARRKKLKIIVYTVNSPWMAAFLKLLFPRIAITTDNPHVMQFLRPRRNRLQSQSSEA